MTDYISVKERLPEDCEDVIFRTERGETYHGVFFQNDDAPDGCFSEHGGPDDPMPEVDGVVEWKSANCRRKDQS